ncbi:MAG TPA: acetylglutamate kinase [Chloroflexia bacterium]|nr:acetylglutamate kinase [Chloroflexia bacterium]
MEPISRPASAGADRAPDLAPYRGQRFVVKLGGEIMLHAAGLDALAADLAALTQAGLQVVVVHGGGPQADALAARLGHTVRKAGGRRITDDDALEVAKMVYGGSLNLEILGALKRHGARAAGLSGVDGNLITVTRRPPTRLRDPATGGEAWVDFGHVGDVAAVDMALLELLLAAGYVPVVASLAADAAGRLYNVNADTIAATIATHLGAARLFLLTNVPGILRDPADRASRLPVLTPAQIAILTADGTIADGMLPKVQNAVAVLQAGVPQVQILDGTTAESLLLRSFHHPGLGTLLLPDDEVLS